jgi:hypothetical protein
VFHGLADDIRFRRGAFGSATWGAFVVPGALVLVALLGAGYTSASLARDLRLGAHNGSASRAPTRPRGFAFEAVRLVIFTPTKGADMTPADVFKEYLERFSSGDATGAAQLLSDDFTFQGPMLQANGKAEFLAGAAQLGPIVRGCELHHQFVDGDQVCSIYDFKIETPAGAGAIPMAEWSIINDGKLVWSRVLFDTAAMTALMPAE